MIYSFEFFWQAPIIFVQFPVPINILGIKINKLKVIISYG